MITLTTPAQINSVLGGNAPISYDRLVLSPFTFDPKGPTVSGTLKLTSTANPTMQTIVGSLSVDLTTGLLQIAVEQLDFYRRISLTGPQITSVSAIVTSAQNSIEAGLVNLGVIAGTQSAGT